MTTIQNSFQRDADLTKHEPIGPSPKAAALDPKKKANCKLDYQTLAFEIAYFAVGH